MPPGGQPAAGEEGGDDAQRDAERPRLTAAVTAVVAALVILCFAHYLGWMCRIWLRSDYYGHGPLIPVVAGYLVYTRRRELAQAAGTRYVWGIPFIAGGLLVHTAAVYLDVNFPQGFALIAVVFGVIVLLRGWNAGRALWFPIAFLAFMVPTGRILVNKFSLPLQLGSTKVAVLFPMLLGLPVEVRGTTIEIPEYTFEVAEACSGLKSSIAMLALAALFAYLIVAPPWKRLAVFVAGLPVALLANAGRITLTLMLARSLGAETAEGFFHSFSGVLVFVLGLTGLFLVSKGLRCDKMREGIF